MDVNRNNVVDCEWRWWMKFYGFEWREVGNCCVRYEWIEALYFDFFYFLKEISWRRYFGRQTENILASLFLFEVSFLKEIPWRRILYSFCDFCMGNKQKTFSLRSLYFFLEGNQNKKGKKGKKKEKCHFRIYSRKQRCSLNFLSIFSLFPFFLQKRRF